MKYKLIILFCFFLAFRDSCIAAQSYQNTKWGKVKTDTYEITLYRNGQYILKVTDLATVKASFLHRYGNRVDQRFPAVQRMNAKQRRSADGKSLIVTYDYFWNKGRVFEQLTLTGDTIAAVISYVPSEKINLAPFTCLFKIISPKTPRGLEISGMSRNVKHQGRIERVKDPKKSGDMRMFSIAAGNKIVNIIAEDPAWAPMVWPQIRMVNNGSYPRSDKVVYTAGEKYQIKYFISITPKTGKLPPPSTKFAISGLH